ncbi:acetylornithine/N-succinyldiaminopimelate aminotransferase [Ruminococcaceae bacterium YRB3002]|nr:acetylornithine/N-succinyldiaminopimelate aminotransferase [Ruminococcaceae bacterium YRB3002]
MSIESDLYLIKDFDKKYCMQVFSPLDVAFVKGKGCYLYDTEGKKYLDMIGGIAVNSVGHGHPKLVKAISEQAKNLIHCSNYYLIPSRSELAYNLCKKASFADKVFFSNSGAEANEAAIKLARGYFYYKGMDRYEIITAKMSFHGRTMGTISATGQPRFSKPFEPVVPGFKYVEFNDIEDLANAVTDKTAAIMLELIQGESGVHPAAPDYIVAVRKLCNERGILFIDDEIQTGMGRTGKNFCYEHYGVYPDIMTLAKGLAGGVPIGATLCSDEVASGFHVGDHGSTFGGNPLATTAANTVIEIMDQEQLTANAGLVGDELMDKLQALKAKFPMIHQVRGRGLLIGIEFNPMISAAMMKDVLFERGFLVSAIGASTIRIAPPLIITKKEALSFANELEKILKSQAKNMR